MGPSMSEVSQAFSDSYGARCGWLLAARHVPDALARLGLVGAGDRLVVFADDFAESFSRSFPLAQLAFIDNPSADSFLAASDAAPSAGVCDFEAVPDDVTAEHPVHHASYAHGAGACFERLYWFCSSIGGYGLRAPDIRSIARAAAAAGAILIVDNTVPSSFGCQPLALGAPVVFEALDRVAGGGLGAKAVGLAVARPVSGKGRRRRVLPQAEDAYLQLALRLGTGAAPAGGVSPKDLACIDDGMRTLGVRMQRHMDGARAIAEYLAAHPRVPRVFYPGLSSHPDHAVASGTLLHGYGPAIDFELPEPVTARSFISFCAPAYRLSPAGGAVTRMSALKGDEARYIRLFAGVDDPIDIVDSLDQALRMFCNPPHA